MIDLKAAATSNDTRVQHILAKSSYNVRYMVLLMIANKTKQNKTKQSKR